MGSNGTLAAAVNSTAITTGDYVAANKTVDFTATPATGYAVKEWKLDGVVQSGTGNTFSITSLTAASNVTVEFEAVYAITFNVAGSNGTLAATVDAATITTGASVAAGKNVIFTATPAAGYIVKQWTLNGVAQTVTGNTFTITALAAASTVTVAFDLPYTVTLSGTGAGATGSGSYLPGATVTIFAGTPPAGQQFRNWTTTSAGVTLAAATNPTTTFTMPSNVVVLTANFEPATGTVTINQSVGGTATATPATGATGTPVMLTATLDPNYTFVRWNVSTAVTWTTGSATTQTATFTMPAGSVTVTPDYLYNAPPYTVSVGTFTGGTVTSDKGSAMAGETVTLTISPNTGSGYELDAIWVFSPSYTAIALSGTGNTRTFTMPSSNVTVIASFINRAYESAWSAAKALIEAATFTLPQVDAPNETAARYRLAALINDLIASTGFVISADDIVIYHFYPAVEGDVTRVLGVNGRIEFRVSPPNLTNSAYSSSAIKATAFIVGNEQIAQTQIRAWVQDGMLHITGLTQGKALHIYNMYGQLIHQSTVVSEEAKISLPARGLYIITSDGKTVKTLY